MDKRRKRWAWLGAAGLLFALAALMMFTGQGEEPTPERREVEFPRRMRAPERERADRRRTYVMPTVVDAGTTPSRPRDPLLAALPRGPGKTAVVIEANALRYSPIGELLLDCLNRDGGKGMARFKEMSGIDPLKDLDRVVVTDDGMILSGNFENAKFKDLLGERVSSDYGEGARVYEPGTTNYQLPDGGAGRGRSDSALGTWNNQMLVIGKSPDSVKEVIDRMEGRGPDEPPSISENSTYGEMYGVLGVEQLIRMLGPDQAELGARLREVAQNVELHVDTSSDVAMVAEIKGSDDGKVTDLGKSLGAALALARMKAQAEGQKETAELLDFARVQPEGSSFKLEMAIPLAVLQERLAFCREDPNKTADAAAGEKREMTP